jgi:hypothetical protein
MRGYLSDLLSKASRESGVAGLDKRKRRPCQWERRFLLGNSRFLEGDIYGNVIVLAVPLVSTRTSIAEHTGAGE